MRRIAVFALLLLAAGAARADPAIDIQNHYLALQVTAADIGKDIAAVAAQGRTELAAARAEAAQAEERLKWVLDNWLAKPPAQ